MAEKLEKDEAKRIEEQVAELGPEGLKQAEAKLEAAKAEHDRPIPEKVITSFPVPDVKSISWIPVDSLQQPGEGLHTGKHVSQSPDLAKHIGSDGQPLPFFVEYDHVEVSISLPALILSPSHVDILLVRVRHSQCFLLPGRRPQPSPTVSFTMGLWRRRGANTNAQADVDIRIVFLQPPGEPIWGAPVARRCDQSARGRNGLL